MLEMLRLIGALTLTDKKAVFTEWLSLYDVIPTLREVVASHNFQLVSAFNELLFDYEDAEDVYKDGNRLRSSFSPILIAIQNGLTGRRWNGVYDILILPTLLDVLDDIVSEVTKRNNTTEDQLPQEVQRQLHLTKQMFRVLVALDVMSDDDILLIPIFYFLCKVFDVISRNGSITDEEVTELRNRHRVVPYYIYLRIMPQLHKLGL